MLFSTSGVRIIGFSVWLVSGYAHVFILFSVVVVPYLVTFARGTLRFSFAKKEKKQYLSIYSQVRRSVNGWCL